MNLPGITWRGESIDDVEILPLLPKELVALLADVNGFILHDGAIHVRGASTNPEWHSIRAALNGRLALHGLYHDVLPTDIPFAQDQVGDQFLLRDGAVWRLFAETGEVEQFCPNLATFLSGLQDDVEHTFNVGLHRSMEPGQLMQAFPPFCMKEAENGVTLSPKPANEVIIFHASLAREIRGLPDGAEVEIKPIDDES